MKSTFTALFLSLTLIAGVACNDAKPGKMDPTTGTAGTTGTGGTGDTGVGGTGGTDPTGTGGTGDAGTTGTGGTGDTGVGGTGGTVDPTGTAGTGGSDPTGTAGTGGSDTTGTAGAGGSDSTGSGGSTDTGTAGTGGTTDTGTAGTTGAGGSSDSTGTAGSTGTGGSTSTGEGGTTGTGSGGSAGTGDGGSTGTGGSGGNTEPPVCGARTEVSHTCNFTQGYYKNHADQVPVTALKLGNVCYTAAQLQDILDMMVVGNGLNELSHQLIAAKLNIAAGSDGSSVAQVIADADARIGDLVCPPVGTGTLPSSADDAQIAALVQALDAFNHSNHCN